MEHVVTLFIPGLLPTHLGLPENTLKPSQLLPFPLTPPSSTEQGEAPKVRLPQMAKLFSNALPTRAPGDQYRFHPAVNTFLSTVVPPKEKERRNREKAKEFKRRMDEVKNNGATSAISEAAGQEGENGKSTFDPVLFLLTPNQMIENEYPIPSYFPVTVEGFMRGDQAVVDKGNEVFLPWQSHAGAGEGKDKVSAEGWRETKRADKAPEGGKYPVLAVDCEMVSTASMSH